MSWFSFKSPPLTPPRVQGREHDQREAENYQENQTQTASSGHDRTMYSTHRAVPTQDLRKNMPTNLLAGSVQGIKRLRPQLRSNGQLMTSAGGMAVVFLRVWSLTSQLCSHEWPYTHEYVCVCVCVSAHIYICIYMGSKIGLSGLFKIKEEWVRK